MAAALVIDNIGELDRHDREQLRNGMHIGADNSL
jgi:hypothetical protein